MKNSIYQDLEGVKCSEISGGKLNEVNLLNPKLLFTNKLFRNFGLSNEQVKSCGDFRQSKLKRSQVGIFNFKNLSVTKWKSKKQESKGSSSKELVYQTKN